MLYSPFLAPHLVHGLERRGILTPGYVPLSCHQPFGALPLIEGTFPNCQPFFPPQDPRSPVREIGHSFSCSMPRWYIPEIREKNSTGSVPSKPVTILRVSLSCLGSSEYILQILDGEARDLENILVNSLGRLTHSSELEMGRSTWLWILGWS